MVTGLIIKLVTSFSKNLVTFLLIKLVTGNIYLVTAF